MDTDMIHKDDREVYCLPLFENSNVYSGKKLIVTLSGHNQHIMLYAKNHYDTTGNIIDDLKIIISMVCRQDIEDISLEDVFHIVHGVWSSWVPLYQQNMLFRDMFIKGGLRWKETVSCEEIIKMMVSNIRLTTMIFKDREIHLGLRGDCILNTMRIKYENSKCPCCETLIPFETNKNERCKVCGHAFRC